jgi:predicted house-cleaning noncanonical NTP pyrophosphatase (MazG superfamily)
MNNEILMIVEIDDQKYGRYLNLGNSKHREEIKEFIENKFIVTLIKSMDVLESTTCWDSEDIFIVSEDFVRSFDCNMTFNKRKT